MNSARKKKENRVGNYEYDYDEFLSALGKAVAQIRHDANLTQGELAARVHKQQPSVAKLENNPTQNIALRVLYEVAEALPVPLSRLFQLAEATLSYGIKHGSEEGPWERAVIEMKKLSPQQQAWLGEVILNILKGPTH